MWTVTDKRQAEESARIAAIGRSVDMLVRQNGQWLIKTRDVAPK